MGERGRALLAGIPGVGSSWWCGLPLGCFFVGLSCLNLCCFSSKRPRYDANSTLSVFSNIPFFGIEAEEWCSLFILSLQPVLHKLPTLSCWETESESMILLVSRIRGRTRHVRYAPLHMCVAGLKIEYPFDWVRKIACLMDGAGEGLEGNLCFCSDGNSLERVTWPLIFIKLHQLTLPIRLLGKIPRIQPQPLQQRLFTFPRRLCDPDERPLVSLAHCTLGWQFPGLDVLPDEPRQAQIGRAEHAVAFRVRGQDHGARPAGSHGVGTACGGLVSDGRCYGVVGGRAYFRSGVTGS